MGKIGILLAEDHTIVRQALRALLEQEPDLVVVGEAEDGREALERAAETQPDIVLMDITMPGLNGIEATQRLRDSVPRARVLILSMHEDASVVVRALRAGACGYVLKRSAAEELVSAIRAVARGECFVSASFPRSLVPRYASIEAGEAKLTPREREVLQLLAEGRRNQEIAALLGTSVKTAEAHRANLLRKLHLRNVAELTRYAVRHGLIELSEEPGALAHSGPRGGGNIP